MKTTTINFVNDFTDCPGGRLKIYGEYSGEEFREKWLEPALTEHDRVVLNLNGAMGFPASFIDEAFGVLVAERGEAEVNRKLVIQLDDNPIALAEIREAMAAHAA
jgi:hypothetical protein